MTESHDKPGEDPSDLMTREEAAAFLGVRPSRLARGGWGPPSLPNYRRPRYYSRRMCEAFLAEQQASALPSDP